MDKRSSLLCTFVNYGRDFLIKLGPDGAQNFKRLDKRTTNFNFRRVRWKDENFFRSAAKRPSLKLKTWPR